MTGPTIRRLRPATSRLVTVSAVAMVLGVLALLVRIPGAEGAYLASITNNTNTAGTATYFTCASAAQGGSNSSDRAYAAYPLAESGGNTAADVSGNGHDGTYYPTGITYGVAGPCPRDSSRAVTFDGVTGYAADTNGVTTSAQQSDEVWFKTTTTAGGLMLASFTTPSTNNGTADRPLYMAASGQVEFGVFKTSAGTFSTAVSPLSYNDGTWHEAQGVFSTTAGCSLYVDGALVATNSGATAASSFPSYTRIGDGSLTGWPNPGGGGAPPSAAWKGSLAFAAVYRYPLTSTQVAAHYRAGT